MHREPFILAFLSITAVMAWRWAKRHTPPLMSGCVHQRLNTVKHPSGSVIVCGDCGKRLGHV